MRTVEFVRRENVKWQVGIEGCNVTFSVGDPNEEGYLMLVLDPLQAKAIAYRINQMASLATPTDRPDRGEGE